MNRKQAIVLGVAPMAFALTGCVSDVNSRVVLGSNVAIDGGAGGGASSSNASLHGLDRSNWGSTTIRVPVDGTVHRATYVSRHLYDDSLARQKGLYPTSETALELDGSRGMGAAEVAAQPGWALLDVALLPVRIAMDPPWEPQQSPRRVYKRQQPGGWLTGGSASAQPVEAAEQAAPSEPAEEAIETDAEILEVTP